MGHALPLLLRETTEFLHSSTYYCVYFGQKRPVLGWNEGFTGSLSQKTCGSELEANLSVFPNGRFKWGKAKLILASLTLGEFVLFDLIFHGSRPHGRVGIAAKNILVFLRLKKMLKNGLRPRGKKRKTLIFSFLTMT
jgi:hypothetical protein